MIISRNYEINFIFFYVGLFVFRRLTLPLILYNVWWKYIYVEYIYTLMAFERKLLWHNIIPLRYFNFLKNPLYDYIHFVLRGFFSFLFFTLFFVLFWFWGRGGEGFFEKDDEISGERNCLTIWYWDTQKAQIARFCWL